MKSITPFILSLVMIFGFQNCAILGDIQPADPSASFLTDPEFHPYIKEFESYHGATIAYVPIGFEDLAGPAGVCYRTTLNGQITNAYVKIDRKYWTTLSEYQRLNLIFHELGHCVLNRPHTPKDLVTICPSSFMFDTIMDTTCLRNNFESYLKEMFP